MKNFKLLLIIIFLLSFSACEEKKSNYVENYCNKDINVKKCLSDRDYFVNQNLKKWKPDLISESVLKDIEKTNQHVGKWIGNTNLNKKIVKIKNLDDIYISKIDAILRSDENFKKAQKIENNIYLLESSIEFNEEESHAIIYNLNFKNNIMQKRLSIDRFGLTSKQLDILKLCSSWVLKKIISCKGKILITGEIFNQNTKGSKILGLFDYYLEAFSLEEQNIQKILIDLKNEEKNKLENLFNKYDELKLKR